MENEKIAGLLYSCASQAYYFPLSMKCSLYSSFAVPRQNSYIIDEAPDELLILTILAITGKLTLGSNLLARNFDFEFMLFFRLVGCL